MFSETNDFFGRMAADNCLQVLTGKGVINNPAVSIIVPAFNVAEFIHDALLSIQLQSFNRYEIVVINDGSPDTLALEDVLARFENEIVYIKQANRGVSAARNAGIRHARGELIALLDPDDSWTPDYLSTQIQFLHENPHLHVVYPNARCFGESRFDGKEFMELSPSRGPVSFESLVTQECNVMSSVLAKRSALLSVGLYDEGLGSSEDFDIWLRLVKHGFKIGYHDRVLVNYRRREGSLSSNVEVACRNISKVLRKAEKAFELTPEERSALTKGRLRFQAILDWEKGKQAIREGNIEGAARRLAEANRFFQSKKLRLFIFLVRLSPSASKLLCRVLFRFTTQ